MISSVLQIFGGMALFLLGIDMLGLGMEELAGKRIQAWLDRMTDRPLKAAVFGCAATATLQSSSLLMVTMIGLINANLFTLEQAVGVMMGQEIGTTLTGQLVAFDIGQYILIAVIVGYVLHAFGAEKRHRALGRALIGIGLVFLGLEAMKSGIRPLTEQPAVRDWLASMGGTPWLGVLAGTLLTALVQSSSATTGLTIAMGMSHAITLTGAISLILGANIGTCFTGLLASLRGCTSSRRASVAQIIINVFGVALFFPFVTPFAALISRTSYSLGRQIANAHSVFNVAVSAIMFPLIPAIVRLCKILVPGQERNVKARTEFLDDHLQQMPPIAIREAAKEVVHMGRLVGEMLEWSRPALLETDEEAIQRVLVREKDEMDPLCRVAEAFIDRLLRGQLSETEQEHCIQLKHWITDIERVADMTENLAQAGQERLREGIRFSDAALAELAEFHAIVSRVWAQAVAAVECEDKGIAESVRQGEEQIDVLEKQLREQHSQRLEDGTCTPKAGVLYVETLRNFERIGDHADNLAVSVLRS